MTSTGSRARPAAAVQPSGTRPQLGGALPRLRVVKNRPPPGVYPLHLASHLYAVGDHCEHLGWE